MHGQNHINFVFLLFFETCSTAKPGLSFVFEDSVFQCVVRLTKTCTNLIQEKGEVFVSLLQ